MLIDEEEIFDTDKDELIWTKIITICPYSSEISRSTHIVKYYKAEAEKEYYIFNYIRADNNGLMIDNYDLLHWEEVIKQIHFEDYCYIYFQDENNIECFRFVTSGKIIKKYIRESAKEYTEEYIKIYELGHH